MRARLAEMQVALMLLTRLPAGQLRAGAPVPSLGQAAWAYPLAGAAVGALGAGSLTLGLALGLPASLAAGLAVAVCVLATGGLHEDGLADLADGFGGGRDVARKLEIMRDSRIGSYGTLALIFALLLRVQALALVAGADLALALAALLTFEMGTRGGLAVMLRALPSARAQGLGHMAADVTPLRAAAALAFGGGAVLVGVGIYAGGAAAGCVLGAMALAQGAIAWLAMRQIGGQTGDVLGAAQQVSVLAGWLVLAALI